MLTMMKSSMCMMMLLIAGYPNQAKGIPFMRILTKCRSHQHNMLRSHVSMRFLSRETQLIN